MNPVLIDTRSWLKFGFIAVFFSSVIFVSGFVVGYKNASKYNQTLGDTASQTVASVDDVESEPVEPATSERITENTNNEVVEPESKIVRETSTEQVVVKSVEVKPTPTEAVIKTSVPAPEPMVIAKTIPLDEDTQTTQSQTALGPENIDEIKFTIQAGLYRSLSGAEKVAKKLKADNYDAYVTEYINKNNELNYNVRVGYFVDKKSALPTLYAFRREKKSDAYIVKFSADSMIFIVEGDS